MGIDTINASPAKQTKWFEAGPQMISFNMRDLISYAYLKAKLPSQSHILVLPLFKPFRVQDC